MEWQKVFDRPFSAYSEEHHRDLKRRSEKTKEKASLCKRTNTDVSQIWLSNNRGPSFHLIQHSSSPQNSGREKFCHLTCLSVLCADNRPTAKDISAFKMTPSVRNCVPSIPLVIGVEVKAMRGCGLNTPNGSVTNFCFRPSPLHISVSIPSLHGALFPSDGTATAVLMKAVGFSVNRNDLCSCRQCRGRRGGGSVE